MNNSVTLYEMTEHSKSEKEFSVDDDSDLADILARNQHFVNDSELFMKAPSCLGITYGNKQLKAHYYVGVDWLEKGKSAVVVSPKISGVDMVRLFWQALQVGSENEALYFSKCYGIRFNEPQIPLADESEITRCLTPLLIFHFISLLDRVQHHGLKRGYVRREENLKGKAKGRILFQKHLKSNVFNKREDRLYCGYNEYTVDIPENRLLKKALFYSESMLNRITSLKKEGQAETTGEVRGKINQLKQLLLSVSDEVNPGKVKITSANKLYPAYKEAVSVAKMVLRQYDYTYQNSQKQGVKTVPFWIDMPRLYELYVYRRLSEKYKNQVLFQVEGYGSGKCKTAVDFVLKEEKQILDAKYKPRYAGSQSGILPDIREICGYARDKKILRTMGIEDDNTNVKCIIVYPAGSETEADLKDNDNISDNENVSPINSLKDMEEKPVKGFINFYKMRVDLPSVKKPYPDGINPRERNGRATDVRVLNGRDS